MNRFKHLTLLSNKIFLIGSFVFLSFVVKAQSVVYYPFNSVLGVSTNPNKPVWGDLRFFTNSYFTSLTIEPSVEFNIARTQRADYYLGGG